MPTISKINVDGVEHEISDTLAMKKIERLEIEIVAALNEIIDIQNSLIGENGGDGA